MESITKKQIQVTAITWSGVTYDSLVYENNKLSEAWFWDEDEKAYMQYSKYFYNPDGTLKKSHNYMKYRSANMYLSSSDSLSYNGNKITDYFITYSDQAQPVPNGYDTSYITLNADKGIALIGSKDTVFLQNKMVKKLRYDEYVLTGSNVTKNVYKDFLFETGSVRYDIEYVSTMEYGTKLNPLYNLLLSNPVLAIDLADDIGAFVLSYNNVTKFVDLDGGIYNIANELLPGTNIVSKYNLSGASQQLQIGFKFRKIAQ